MRNALLALVLTSCGGEIFNECSDPLFKSVRSDHVLDCTTTQAASQLAYNILNASGMWVNPAIDGHLTIHDTSSWIDDTSTRVAGVTTLAPVNSYVDVGSTEVAMVHEAFHIQDFYVGNWVVFKRDDKSGLFLAQHDGWESNGRFALANLYGYALHKEVWVNGSCNVEPTLPETIHASLLRNGWGPVIDAREVARTQKCKE
jgi:hypothetical protein